MEESADSEGVSGSVVSLPPGLGEREGEGAGVGEGESSGLAVGEGFGSSLAADSADSLEVWSGAGSSAAPAPGTDHREAATSAAEASATTDARLVLRATKVLLLVVLELVTGHDRRKFPPQDPTNGDTRPVTGDFGGLPRHFFQSGVCRGPQSDPD